MARAAGSVAGHFVRARRYSNAGVGQTHFSGGTVHGKVGLSNKMATDDSDTNINMALQESWCAAPRRRRLVAAAAAVCALGCTLFAIQDATHTWQGLHQDPLTASRAQSDKTTDIFDLSRTKMNQTEISTSRRKLSSKLARSTRENRRSQPRQAQDTVQHRSVLVVRMLDQAEDAETDTNARNQLNQVLFDGGTLVETGAPFPSVRQQLWDCSGGTVQLDSLGVTSVVVNSVPPELLAERNAWVEATAALVMQPGSAFVEMASSDTNSNSNTAVPYFDEDATSRMRASADHVILVLPPSYPDESFLAHAEVNHSISVFSHTWSISLSAFMHELGHNIMLRHAGGVHERELYGDTTGMMGRSSLELGSPRKCHNAAQHWMMGWYNRHRASLLEPAERTTNGGPVRIDVAAFVDHGKLNDNGMVVLVQLDADTYLQYNRAKDHNADTGMMADRVVVVRDNGNSTRLLAGLDDQDETTYQYKSTSTTSIVTIQVCQLVIQSTTDSAAVDYAIVAVDVREADQDFRDAEQDVEEFCRKLRKSDDEEKEDKDPKGREFTMSPTPSPVEQPNDEPTGFFGFDPFDDADIAPTAAPAISNNTAVSTKAGNLRSKFQQLVNKASSNPEAVYAGMGAAAVLGLFLLGCCCGCWCCCRRRRRKRKAAAAAKNDESTIASFFSSVKLY